MTSAFLAAQLFLGQDFDYIIVPFDEIFEAVHSGDADAGLIIHEGQLTYEQEGFTGVLDLGEWWKRTRNLPLPLGGNVIRKDIPLAVQAKSAISCGPAFVMRSNIAHLPSPTAWLTREGWIFRWRTNSSACTSTSLPLITAKRAGLPSTGS